jgi:hypothetical protein
MERSDPVTDILARIMMRLDRSSESLLNSLSPFEDADAMAEAMPPALPRQAYGRRRSAQPNRDLVRRKPRDLEPEIFAPMASDDSLGAQNKSYGLER